MQSKLQSKITNLNVRVNNLTKYPMANKPYSCECGSKYVIQYDKEICETDPLYCPFCGEYMIDEIDGIKKSFNEEDGYED
jgi:hypothetical protein